MVITSTRTFRLHAARRALLLACLAGPAAVMASPASDALLELGRDGLIQRSLSLKDLGIGNPVVLDQSDNRQEFFLPVPRGVTLTDAALTLEGNYLKGEDVPATLNVAIDGRPQVAQRVVDREGNLHRALPIEPRARESGFVQLTVNWSSPIGLRLCESDRLTANVLTLSPDTRLTYRYPAQAVRGLDDTWHTLPGQPVLLVAGGKLDKQSFDAAWRVGVALERTGKRAVVKSLPAVGDEIRLAGLQVPAALSSIPAFAAFAGKDTHKIADPAEVGALIVLGGAQGDLAITDSALTGQIDQALDALAGQLQNDADAARELTQWRERHATLASDKPAAQQVKVALLGHQPMISISPDAGAQAAGIFDSIWRRVLTSRQATVFQAGQNAASLGDTTRLTALGASTTVFDVVTRGDWNMTFPLAAISSDGRIPGELVLDLAAAPGASITKPVASVIWNGVLLNAKQLDADGHPERLAARVPGYALGVTNNLRVSFQRQPVSPNCAETPQGYPVNVLPSSFVRAGSAQPDGTFVGILPLLAGTPQVLVPQTALDAPVTPLRNLIALANASALSPVRAELVLADGAQAVKPTKPFLSMGVPVDGVAPVINVVDGKRLTVRGKAQNDQPWLDVEGPDRLSTASVVKSGTQNGILWQALGEHPARFAESFVLTRGNAVVLGEQGALAWIDTTDPGLSQPPGMGGGPFYEWRQYLGWGVPLLGALILLALVLAVMARRARARSEKK
ncbi:hypothetical protein [Bordetella genomosp. 5]|uniref:Cyclic di-GMP-binding protein n=1 Tax=Bordetella genomosp. 5 TaxID=1395608 RepID=A0A261THS6_9BORD|nr:hypothetical protein [Bordetella genomosp. 5]OZI49206.1 hypothetical protein CAL25_14295 [Bordetella genomosp. 5]